jgi:hypothetical protein
LGRTLSSGIGRSLRCFRPPQKKIERGTRRYSLSCSRVLQRRVVVKEIKTLALPAAPGAGEL